MKIGIIAWDYEEFESLHLERVARQLDQTPVLFTLDDVACVDRGGRLDVLVKGERAADLDVIISRAQLRRQHWQSDLEALTLLSNVEGVPILDPAAHFADTESKLLGVQKLGQAGLRVPPTASCRTVEAVRERWERWGRIVVKPSFGYAGSDVERIDGDFDAASDMVRDLLGRHGSLVVQPFLPHPQGDIRVTVVGGEIGVCFRRVPPPGKWKANVALGAAVVPYEPDDRIRGIALKAARVMGITIAGIDIIEYEDDYLVIEVNTTPGWYIMEQQRQDGLAAKIIRYAMERAIRERLTPA